MNAPLCLVPAYKHMCRSLVNLVMVNRFYKSVRKNLFIKPNRLLIKPFVLLLMLGCLLQVHAKTYAQTVTLNLENASLETAFSEIKKQTSYRFFYEQGLLKQSKKISLHVTNALVEKVLDQCFRDQPLTYSIVEKIIVVKPREAAAITAAANTSSPAALINITGRVTNDKDQPIARATVTVKKANYGTFTNDNGEFTLSAVDANAILSITSVGYEPTEFAIRGQTSITTQLKAIVNKLDEAIVVAYNTTTQRSNTGSVTVVKGEDIRTLPNLSVERSLQGLIPGLQITSGTGQPGGSTSNIIIRGIGTGSDLASGATIRNPLIVLDGTPVTQDPIQGSSSGVNTPVTSPMAQINPADIESISVLKDAAAIALYGTKASNGVILITTKHGKAGKTLVAFRHRTDFSSRLKTDNNVLSQDEYLQLLFESYRNASPGITDAAILADLRSPSKFPVVVSAPGDTSFYPAPNWLSELYDRNAVTVSNDLSFSGGSEKSNFYFGISYIKQNGIINNTGYERPSLRYNFSSKVLPVLTVGINSSFSYNIQQNAGNYDDAGSLTGLAYTLSPLLPVRLNSGDYYLLYKTGAVNNNSPNPVASADWNNLRNTAYRGIGNVFAELSFLKRFKFKTNLGIDYMFSNLYEKVDPRLININLGVGSTTAGLVRDYDFLRTSAILNNTLRYDYSIGKHNINVIAGQEAQKFDTKTVSASATGFTSPFYTQVASGQTRTVSTTITKERLVSYFLQGNYGYNDKYFISLSGRRDGSSKFGSNERYANFWSAGAGWVLTGEDFMKGTRGWLDFFKIRGSIGVAGNANTIGPDARIQLLNFYTYDGQTAVRLPPGNNGGNEDIKWETSFNTDIGLEVKAFDSRINITVDLYKRKISNLLYTVDLPGLTGNVNQTDNIGDMENRGAEIMIAADLIRNKNFRWSINANWSTNKNKLVKSYLPLTTSGILINQEGENFNSFYMKRWVGVDRANGKPLWVDSTGKFTSDYNAAKPEIVGKPQPDGFGGVTNSFSYKGVELSVFLYYQYGFQVYNTGLTTLLNDGRTAPYLNQAKQALNRWQKPGDDASNPRRVLNNTDGGNQTSTRYLFDGDNIRLKNILLGYTFSRPLIQKWKLSSLRIYVQGNNLAVWTKKLKDDPDNGNYKGSTAFTYPQQTSFSIGADINF